MNFVAGGNIRMEFEYNEKTDITDLKPEPDDICTICEIYEYCPLLGALAANEDEE